MRRTMLKLAAFLVGVTAACGASADVVSWTDWTTAATNSVTGTMTIDSTSVGVTYTGAYYFAQTNGIGTNYWTNPSIYESALVSNAPPDADIIALGDGGTGTITFSQAVVDPLIALVSWNGNVVDFGVPIEILSYGCGYWGCGTPILNATGTGFTGSGEVHGVIELIGTFTSITFTNTTEYWHGFTVGAVGLGEGGGGTVPEPGTLALLSLALVGGGLAGSRRRKQK